MITYTFTEKEGQTLLHAIEEFTFDMREEQFEEAVEGWDLALESVKDLAEKIHKKEKKL